MAWCYIIEGKDGRGPRVGSWDVLTTEKVQYAAKDAYAAITVHQRLAQMTKLKDQPPLVEADTEAGLQVTIHCIRIIP